MEIFTHINLSMKLKQAIEDTFDIKLNTKRFVLGNIKPDLTPELIRIPHNKKDSIEFIKSEIKYLLENKLDTNQKISNNYSERLGIIAHYISDYCCFVHGENYHGGMIKHLLYEMKMSLHLHFNPRSFRSYYNENNIVINKNYNNLCNYLDNTLENYSNTNESSSQSTDLAYAFEMCKSICLSIIEISLSNEALAVRAA